MLSCPASAVLPQEHRAPGDAALWGQEVHALKEGKPTSARVAKWFGENYPSDYLRTLWPETGEHEPVYWMAPDGTISRLTDPPSHEERRSYPARSFFFSVDYMDLSGDVPRVDDLKTGMPPDNATQLKAYGWLALQLRPEAQEVKASYTNWRRYPKGERAKRSTYTFQRQGLQDWWETKVLGTRDLVTERPADALAQVHPGDHCFFCPAKAHCPEFQLPGDP